MSNSKKLLAEVRKRTSVKSFDVNSFCFDKQLKFINDGSRFKTAVCSRRSGKSLACVSDLISTAKSGKNNNCAYITLSRTSAKRIIWPSVKQIIKDYDIKCKLDNTELTVEFEEGSTLFLIGAKDLSEIEKIRGISLKRVYIDESQSFRESVIVPLIDDVLAYATMDVSGSICLIGTPGPVASGYFYNASHSPTWSNHKWTILDNPWIKIKSGKEPQELLAEERIRKGISADDPSYLREALGQWINDYNSLVFKFDKSSNVFTTQPTEQLEYIFGIDIGFNDADSISVIGFSRTTTNVYLIDEVITTKQNITKLVAQIKELQAKYNPVKMVMDAGALGKKIQEELRDRHQLNIEAADKARKFEFIELLNDDLRTGRFKAFANSRFAEDCFLLEWDRDDPTKPKISDRYHSDACDSTLYGWRECRNFFSNLPKERLSRHSAEWMAKEEERLMEAFERKKHQNELDPTVEDLEYIMSDDE